MRSSIEEQKKTLALRTKMDEGAVRYIYNEDIEQSYDKSYVYKPLDFRMQNFMRDEFGVVSDCFIMYPILKMKFTPVQTIMDMQEGFARRDKELLVIYESDQAKLLDIVKRRLTNLYDNGFITKHTYRVNIPERGISHCVLLYSVVRETASFISHKLDRREPYDEWQVSEPLHKMIGYAASSSVASKMQNMSTFVNLESGVCKFLKSGTVFFPSEHRYKKDDVYYYVVFVFSFFHHNKKIQNQRDYTESCVRRIGELIDYLKYRTKKGVTSVVVTVEDNQDLLRFADFLMLTENTAPEILNHVYFTSDGIMSYLKKGEAIGEDFLHMYLDSESSCGYNFVACKPEFLA